MGAGWCLHDVVITHRPHKPLKYDLNDYTDLIDRPVTTEYLESSESRRPGSVPGSPPPPPRRAARRHQGRAGPRAALALRVDDRPGALRRPWGQVGQEVGRGGAGEALAAGAAGVEDVAGAAVRDCEVVAQQREPGRRVGVRDRGSGCPSCSSVEQAGEPRQRRSRRRGGDRRDRAVALADVDDVRARGGVDRTRRPTASGARRVPTRSAKSRPTCASAAR